MRLYSVTYLPTIERMTEVERGQGGYLQVINLKRDKGNYLLHKMISRVASVLPVRIRYMRYMYKVRIMGGNLEQSVILLCM